MMVWIIEANMNGKWQPLPSLKSTITAYKTKKAAQAHFKECAERANKGLWDVFQVRIIRYSSKD